MRIGYLMIFAVAATIAMTNSAFATHVPDVANTSSMLGVGLVALAGLRAWMKK